MISVNITNVLVSNFSDALHPGRELDYGQTGIVTGLRIENGDGPDIFHTIDWISHRQKRVSYSSYGTEIIATAHGDDRGYYLNSGINSLFTNRMPKHELTVDSRALYDTITTLHESTEYRLRQTVQRIRNSFQSQELDVMRWIPGTGNIADALTKRDKALYKKVNELCADGLLNVKLNSGYEVDSETWH